MTTFRSQFLAAAVPLAVTAFAVTACGSSGASSAGGAPGGAKPSAAGPATIAVTNSADLGQILVDGSGRSVYLFLADHGTASSCAGECAKVWPPVTTGGAPHAGAGASTSLVGTTARSDGSTQATYHGHPLYYYVADSKPGQTSGEGLNQFGAEWYVLSPRGDKVEKGGS